MDKAYFHKGCGGEVVIGSCSWDDHFLRCSECDQHENCDNWEMEENFG